MAQVIVNEEEFAPYEFVSFEAMTIESEKALTSEQPELIYFFYDSIDTSKLDVINELQTAIEYCEKYIPNENKKNLSIRWVT